MVHLLAIQKATELFNLLSKQKPLLKKAAVASSVAAGVRLLYW